MRGHARGPFGSVSAVQPLPVLRVQKQVKLTPNDVISFQIQASATAPVVLRILPWVRTAAAGGTNIVKLGTAANDDAYIEAGDVDEETTGFATEKKFALVADTTLIATMVSAAIAATKALTISAITAANTQTVVIGGQTYTFNTSLTDTANNVLIGADATAMGANLAAAINGSAGAGTTYGTGTVANASVTASAALGVVTVTAITPGTAGNDIAIAETLTNSAWAGGALFLTGGEALDTVAETWLFLDV